MNIKNIFSCFYRIRISLRFYHLQYFSLYYILLLQHSVQFHPVLAFGSAKNWLTLAFAEHTGIHRKQKF